MADTTFVDQQTVVPASWLNDVNDAVYNYNNGATGAVSRTLNSKLTELVISIKDFGATGDGVTNDTAAIQAALNAGAGKIILFPIGIYNITSVLNAPNSCQIYGDSRETTILRYTGSTTITGGAVIKFANKSNFTVKNIGFRFTNSVIANNSIALHIEDCVYYSVEDLGIGGGTTTSGQSSIVGIKCDQTTSGFVPPRGSGVFRNILYVVEPPDAGSSSSAAIWIKGHASQPMNHITFDGEGNLEHGYYAIKLENANNCYIGNWQMRGATFTEIALINSTSNTIVGPQIAPRPSVGIGISIDATSFDNTVINPGWNFSSGTPLSALSDNGQRSVIINSSAVGALTPPNKFFGAMQFRKSDSSGASAQWIRSLSDPDAGIVLRSDTLPISNAWFNINRGSGPSQDLMRLEGGATLFERVDVDGQHYFKTPNSPPADATLSASQCTFYLDQGANTFKVKVKYTDGTVKIGTLAVI